MGEVLISEWRQACLLKPSAIKPVLRPSNNVLSSDALVFFRLKTNLRFAQQSPPCSGKQSCTALAPLPR
jgi:hypothetical protein